MVSPVKIKLEFFDLCYRVVVILVLILVVEVMTCMKHPTDVSNISFVGKCQSVGRRTNYNSTEYGRIAACSINTIHYNDSKFISSELQISV